jgi:hypothetical protein
MGRRAAISGHIWTVASLLTVAPLLLANATWKRSAVHRYSSRYHHAMGSCWNSFTYSVQSQSALNEIWHSWQLD